LPVPARCNALQPIMRHMHQVWAPENDMAASSLVELLRLCAR
jgi:hypothetical protein